MDFLTALGPVFFDRPSFAILRIRGDGRTDLALGPTPVEALRQLPARAGVPAAVDERHPFLATELGLPTARPTDAQSRSMAIAAIGLLSQGSLEKITDPELLEAFFDAFRAFEEKRPWRHFDSDVGVEATVIGALGRERELVILGSRGEQRGLVIYPTRGMTARLTAGDHEAAKRMADSMDAIVVYFEDEDAPLWAKELVSEGLGLRHVPVIARLERGRRVPIRSDEARVIIAALTGVIAVVTERGPATGAFEHKGKRVEVQIAPGEGFDPEGMKDLAGAHRLSAGIQAPAGRI